LKAFELDEDDLKVSKMCAVIKTNWPDIAQASSGRMEMFIGFMNNKCRELSKFSPELDIVHLAKDVTAIKSVTLHRLSEYRRFCVACITPGQSDAIKSNVEKQKTAAGRFDRKTGLEDKYHSVLAYIDHKREKLLQAFEEF
jgi:hypothetical protein